MKSKNKNKISKIGNSRLIKNRNRAGYVFVAPFLIGFFFFLLLPIIQSFIFSLNDIRLHSSGYDLVWRGFQNYNRALFIDVRFRKLIIDSLIKTVTNTTVVLPFSFFSALILSHKFKGRTLARSIFFLPVIISTGVMATIDGNAVISMMMERATSSGLGGVQTAISAQAFVTNIFSDSLPMWLVNFIARATEGIYDIVIMSGLQIIIFLGGLNTISPSLYEASNIEGATAWVNFWKITFPMATPYILVNTIYTIIDSFTNIKNPLINQIRNYLTSFRELSFGSAISWLYFGVIFIILGLVFAFLSRRVFYYE